MGLILNGELYRGGRDGAGEFGHSTVVEGGKLCNCGKRGCVEAYVGEPACAAPFATPLARFLPLIQRSCAPELARSGFRPSSGRGHTLGLGLAAVMNALTQPSDRRREGAHFLDLLLPELRSTLALHASPIFRRRRTGRRAMGR